MKNTRRDERKKTHQQQYFVERNVIQNGRQEDRDRAKVRARERERKKNKNVHELTFSYMLLHASLPRTHSVQSEYMCSGGAGEVEAERRGGKNGEDEW